MVIDSGKEDCSQTLYVCIRNTSFLPLCRLFIRWSECASRNTIPYYWHRLDICTTQTLITYMNTLTPALALLDNTQISHMQKRCVTSVPLSTHILQPTGHHHDCCVDGIDASSNGHHALSGKAVWGDVDSCTAPLPHRLDEAASFTNHTPCVPSRH